MSGSPQFLPLANLSQRHFGLTEALGEAYHEAARVCLDRHHTSPTSFKLRVSQKELEAVVDWHTTDARCQAAHANEIDTTEAGAYACALATAELTQGLVAIRRAETKTGADWYLAPAGDDVEDLEGSLRLEVSGTDKGDQHYVERTLLKKLEQAARGRSNLPAMAAVVAFQLRLIVTENVTHT